MADEQDAKSEELGKQLAEQMRGKLDADEAHRLSKETDDDFDAQVLLVLEPKLKAAVLGFNDVAKAADQLTVEKGSNMLQLFKANLPVYAAKISHRQLHIVPAMQNTPAATYSITGGPEEFIYNGKSQSDFLKELLTMAASGSAGLV